MPGLDERLTEELRRLCPPSDAAPDLMREIDRRRGRRRVGRRAAAAALAVVVLAGTVGGFTLLRLAFRAEPAPPPVIQPEPPTTPGVGLDVGLPFRLCGVSKLPRVLFGDHTGAVWLAERYGKDGCPDAYEGSSIAAADTDGDGLADVWVPFPCRGGCDPSADRSGRRQRRRVVGGLRPAHAVEHAAVSDRHRRPDVRPGQVGRRGGWSRRTS